MKNKKDKRIERQYKLLGEILYLERVNGYPYKQEELAKRLGVPQSYISKVEKGNRRIDIIELMELCHALNISLFDLAVKIESRFSQEFPNKVFIKRKKYYLSLLHPCIR
ncbi:MAG: helix-turn-helix transcriptional regulator [Bacteroidales bacterium]|nr:helix-turn-helix transcriptional regulator [Bacteroidales bacterium]